MRYFYEIFLRHAEVGKTEWNSFLLQVADYLGSFARWQIQILPEQNVLHYYLLTNSPMPLSFSLNDFLLKPTDPPATSKTARFRGLYRNKWLDNYVSIHQDLHKRQYNLHSATINFHGFKKFLIGTITISYNRGQHNFTRRLLLFSPSTFLSINFTKSKSFLFKKFPKYLKLDKVTKLLQSSSADALFEIDPFPYFETSQYLRHSDYDFAKHSLVIGGSGSGKSKFLASLINKIHQTSAKDHKIVVIDPHDALYQDCVGIQSQSVVNFQNLAESIDLFSCNSADINASVELILTLMQSLINDNYNGRLERVLRYATYLLMSAGNFSFLTLRKLLLDLEFRNEIVTQYKDHVPVSVSHFFLTDFNELKSQNYNDAIAPIVAFIDEMQMVPIFNTDTKLASLSSNVQSNFLNIFSLNRLKLGTKVVRTIAGLLMQQLFLYAQQQPPEQHLIVIIDEVAVVENPIIARFLAELRKFNTSVILAGQYFSQISSNLQSAIFANVSNYYLFRVSQHDAKLLTTNLKIQPEGSDNPEDAEKLLTGLKLRECLVQVAKGEEVLPIFKARTTDLIIHDPAQSSNTAKSSMPNSAQTPDSTNLQKFFTPKNPPKTILENKQKFSQDFIVPKPAQKPDNLNNNFSSNPETPENHIPTPNFSPPSAGFSFEIDPDLNINDIANEYSTTRKIKGEK